MSLVPLPPGMGIEGEGNVLSDFPAVIKLGLMLIETNTFKNWFTKCCYCKN